MKKLLVALALGAAAVSASAPAAAQDVRGRVSITIGEQSRYGQDYYGRPQYGYGQQYNNNRGYGVTRHRNENFLYWKYFANARSYYPGRCFQGYDVVVRDPRTGRLVCMNRGQYERYRYEVQGNVRYR